MCSLRRLDQISSNADKPRALLEFLRHLVFYGFACKASGFLLRRILEAMSQTEYDEWDARGFKQNTLRDAPLQPGERMEGKNESLLLPRYL